MEQQYFVVLELPSGSNLNARYCPVDFWTDASKAIRQGKAKMISRRQDTGVSEELRNYVQHVKQFTTFVLVTMPLPSKHNTLKIFKRASHYVASPANKIIVDGAENFQLVAIDA